MPQKNASVLSGNKVATHNRVEFNVESFVMVTQENLRLQKELNEALAKIVELKREANIDFKKIIDTSPHLRIA